MLFRSWTALASGSAAGSLHRRSMIVDFSDEVTSNVAHKSFSATSADLGGFDATLRLRTVSQNVRRSQRDSVQANAWSLKNRPHRRFQGIAERAFHSVRNNT